MYAIVDIAGQQFRVENGQKIYVHRLENKEGENVDFDQVLLIDNDGKISIGEPLVEGAFVEGKVLTHLKGDKVIVFKKKRRKGYQTRNGHRQFLSHIEILAINEKGAVKKGAKATVKAELPEVKAETTKKSAAETKPSAPKAKSVAKKPEAKKAATVAKKPVAAKKPAVKKTEAAAKKPVAAKKSTTKATATEKKSTKVAPAKSSAKPKASSTKGKAADKAK